MGGGGRRREGKEGRRNGTGRKIERGRENRKEKEGNVDEQDRGERNRLAHKEIHKINGCQTP